jgi:hypothetical protein
MCHVSLSSIADMEKSLTWSFVRAHDANRVRCPFSRSRFITFLYTKHHHPTVQRISQMAKNSDITHVCIFEPW